MSNIIDIKNTVSVSNSTNIVLGAGATWEGVWESISDFNVASVTLLTGNATDGVLWFDLSMNGGTNFISIPRSISDTTFNLPHKVAREESHIRIRYVNGTTAQTGFFLLQTIYSISHSLGLNYRLDEAITDEFEATLVKSISTKSDPNGVYINDKAGGYVRSATTNINLGIGGVFTSPCIYVNGYSQISLELLSDVDGSFSGTWYTDEACTDATRTLAFPYSASGGMIPISSPTFGEYLKISYTNGAIAQTDFHLGLKFLNVPLSGFVLGLPTPIPQNAVANLQRVVNSADFDRNRDLIIGQESKRSFGVNEAVPTSYRVVWSEGTVNYPFLQTGETLRVKAGGNASDTLLGIGARTLTVQGLNNDWEEIEASIDLDGINASLPTLELFLRVNDAFVTTVGAYGGVNIAKITLETSTGTTLAVIDAGVSESRMSVKSVPKGKSMWINHVYPSVGFTDSADVKLSAIFNADSIVAPFQSVKKFQWGVSDFSGSSPQGRSTYLKFPEKTDVIGEAKQPSGGGAARVNLDYDFDLVLN